MRDRSGQALRAYPRVEPSAGRGMVLGRDAPGLFVVPPAGTAGPAIFVGEAHDLDHAVDFGHILRRIGAQVHAQPRRIGWHVAIAQPDWGALRPRRTRR